MTIWKNNHKEELYTVIIGCGRLGANLANSLSEQKQNVLIIDRSKESFRKLSTSFGGLTVVGDATDMDVLSEAEIEKADVALVVTDSDNVNIMVSQMIKEIFHTALVIARLYDSERKYVYEELGIDIICPADLSAMEIKKLLAKNEEEVL